MSAEVNRDATIERLREALSIAWALTANWHNGSSSMTRPEAILIHKVAEQALNETRTPIPSSQQL